LLETANFFRAQDDLWEIRRENLLIQRNGLLGSGAFGDVYIAKLVGDSGIKRVYRNVIMLSKFHDCEVAVKILPSFASEACKKELQEVSRIFLHQLQAPAKILIYHILQEIIFMKSLKYHPHVICLLGHVSSDTISPLLVLEYCANGDLLKFVRANKGQIINVSILVMLKTSFLISAKFRRVNIENSCIFCLANQ
jgi:serine/threonine protein kinase